jgi:hypothetical protein
LRQVIGHYSPQWQDSKDGINNELNTNPNELSFNNFDSAARR